MEKKEGEKIKEIQLFKRTTIFRIIGICFVFLLYPFYLMIGGDNEYLVIIQRRHKECCDS